MTITTTRDILLLKAVTGDAEGWGECVAMSGPLYSSEYVDAAADVRRRFLIPRSRHDENDSSQRHRASSGPVPGPPDGKSGARDGAPRRAMPAASRSRASEFGAVHGRVPCGVSIRIAWSIPALLAEVGHYLDAGYLRVKLKIEPGWEVAPVSAVRERYGDEVLLQVDANAAYQVSDARHLAPLNAFNLLLIEQPPDEDDLLGTPSWAGSCEPRFASTSRSSRRARRLRASPSAPARSSTSRPAESVATSSRWLPRGTTDPRRLRGARCPGLVRRHARNRAWPSSQRRPGRTAELRAAGRHLRVGAVLPHRHHHALRSRQRTLRGADLARPRSGAGGRRTGWRHVDGVAPHLSASSSTSAKAVAAESNRTRTRGDGRLLAHSPS